MKKLIAMLLIVFVSNAYAKPDPHSADRESLRAVLDDMVKALNEHDFDGAAKHLHEQGVITYYNAEVTVGHEQSREYFNRMLKESKAIVKEYRLKGDVSAPAIFHGNTAIAYGVTEEYFKLTEGLEFTLTGHWSATIQRLDGTWKITNLHFSANLFDNPLLNAATQLQWIIGAIAFFVGLILMFIIMKISRKK